MKAVIVYESLFGNTKAVAEAIAAGLSGTHETSVMSAGSVDLAAIASCDLLVAGSPTHGHGLPKPETRAAGRKSGVPESIVNAPGIRELLTSLPAGRGRAAAAFDTRLRGPRWLWGAASRRITGPLVEHGYSLVLAPQTFLVRGMRVPTIRDTELERARLWGARLGIAASQLHPTEHAA